MFAIRAPIAVAIGALLTTSMFWLLWHLVGTAFDVSGLSEATRIDFSRMRRDTEVATKRDEKVERERPPPTPETPRMAFAAGGIENNVAQLTPVVDARGAMSRMSMTAGSDRDVIPLVRIAPDYPPRALSRGLEGWVQVQFTISTAGSIRDAVVLKSSDSVFERAAITAVSKWKYQPQLKAGKPVEVANKQVMVRFQLPKG